MFSISTQNHHASLKTMLIRLHTQSHFLENVAKENWSSPDNIEMTGRLSGFETCKYLVYRICILKIYAYTLACAFTVISF